MVKLKISVRETYCTSDEVPVTITHVVPVDGVALDPQVRCFYIGSNYHSYREDGSVIASEGTRASTCLDLIRRHPST